MLPTTTKNLTTLIQSTGSHSVLISIDGDSPQAMKESLKSCIDNYIDPQTQKKKHPDREYCVIVRGSTLGFILREMAEDFTRQPFSFLLLLFSSKLCDYFPLFFQNFLDIRLCYLLPCNSNAKSSSCSSCKITWTFDFGDW